MSSWFLLVGQHNYEMSFLSSAVPKRKLVLIRWQVGRPQSNTETRLVTPGQVVAQGLVGWLLRSKVERRLRISRSISQRKRDGKSADRSGELRIPLRKFCQVSITH